MLLFFNCGILYCFLKFFYFSVFISESPFGSGNFLYISADFPEREREREENDGVL